jgi:hypothetical protein
LGFHEQSKFYELCEFDFHETIESIVLEYSDKGEVFVCGDLNSRIGEINDFLYNDELDQYVMSVEQLTDQLTHEILTKPSISIKLLSFNQVSLKNKMS